MTRNQLLVIAGPTASGKSDLAMAVCRSRSGEIVNCDSMQMVRGLDVGTAKPTIAERRRVPHHLFDVIEPAERYSAGRYMIEARRVCAEIAARNRLPVVVGGTGLYLRALLRGVFAAPASSERLRVRLAALAERVGGKRLHELLAARDPAAAGRIEAADLRRIIRALEVWILSRRPISDLQGDVQPIDNMEVIKVGLRMERRRLYDRIERRVESMFRGGLLTEVQHLLDQGLDSSAKGFEALGYRQAVAHLEGRMGLHEAIAETQKETRRYAKRQMTWFRREPDLVWLEGPGERPELVGEVEGLLDGGGVTSGA